MLATLKPAPLTISILFGDYSISLRYAVVVVGLFALGLGLSRLPDPRRIQTNEAMGHNLLDSLFEVVSAIGTVELSAHGANHVN